MYWKKVIDQKNLRILKFSDLALSSVLYFFYNFLSEHCFEPVSTNLESA